MRKKILIPYFLAGAGHLSIASAVRHFLNQKKPDWEVRLLEPAEELKDRALTRYFKEAWRRILAMSASAAQFIFDMDDAFPGLSSFVTSQYMRTAISKAMGFLAGYGPDLILSTHWGCTHLFHSARGKLDFTVPLYYVFTELAGAYQLLNCGADIYFTMSEEAAKDLMSEGIPVERLRVINLVVRPEFLQRGMSREEARKRIGIPPQAFTLLISVGGEGIGTIDRFISAFLKEVPRGWIIVMTGRNEKLFHRLSKKFEKDSVLVFGFRKDMDVLMSAADVLAGKSGASFSMEAMITGTPFLVTHIGAPSERPNMEYIVENGFGWYAPNPSRFVKVLREIRNNPKAYNRDQESLDRAKRRNGAEEIAEAVIRALE